MALAGLWRTRCAVWLAATWAASLFAQPGPTILFGDALAVRPGEAATLVVQAVGAPGTVAQLAATIDPRPEWLTDGEWGEWMAGPSPSPRLEIAVAPPAGVPAGAYELVAHATDSAGFTSQASVAWEVLPPLCLEPLHYAEDGLCRLCPPNQVPNSARSGCEPCPAGTERVAGGAECVACPAGQGSEPGASCGCGPAARLTQAGCVACPPHSDARRNPRNCDPCPLGQQRLPGMASCRPCPLAKSAEGEACGNPGTAAAAATGAQAEPSGPAIVLAVEAGRQSPSARCGGSGRLCVLETAGPVRVTMSVRNPPAVAYRDCRLEVAAAGPNTATQSSGGRFNDYRLVGNDGVTLKAGRWSADATLAVEDDGKDEEPEALTLRGGCGGSSDGEAHLALRQPPTTIWIGDVPWPKLTVAPPTGGTVTGAGIDCGGERNDCEQAFRNERITLAATADAHHRFAGWGGACSGSAPICDLLVDADKAVSASFDATSHLLTVARPENGRVAGPGIDCGSGTRADCEERLAAGTTVRLTATADPNHRFTGWSGACSGTAPTCSVLADAAKTVAAAFSPEQRLLLVSLARGGSIAGPGIDCGYGAGGDCAERYDHGAEVELAATANADQEFVAWSGCESETSACTLTMDGNRTAGATFRPVQRTLTATPPTHGYLTAKGLDCGAGERTDCEEAMPHGSRVVVRAVAAEGYAFSSWSDACSGTAPKCALTLDQDRAVGAAFDVATWELTVDRPRGGKVTAGKNEKEISCSAVRDSDCSETYNHGTKVVLTATPNMNYEIGSWGGKCAGKKTTCTLTMDDHKKVSVSFKLVTRTLTVEPASNGCVTSEKAGISCGSCTGPMDCTEDYSHGDTVDLIATPNVNYTVDEWMDDCSGTAPKCEVEMYGDKDVKATFKLVQRTLTVTPPNNGYVMTSTGISCGSGSRADCKKNYEHGTIVTLTAIPDANYEFGAWTGQCDSDSPSGKCKVTMDADNTVGATFTLVEWKLTVKVTDPSQGYVTGQRISCGAGRTDCKENYSHGTRVPLIATANGNNYLSGWSGACSGSDSTCVVTMDADKDVVVDFMPNDPDWTLYLTLTTAGGYVTGNGIDCRSGPRSCSRRYTKDATVTLTAFPENYTGTWSVGCSDPGSTCSPTPAKGKATVNVTFTLVQRKLTVARPSNGYVAGGGISCGSGSRDTCAANHGHGTPVALTATADQGYAFVAWGDACSGTVPACNLTLDSDKTVSATFQSANCAAGSVSWSVGSFSCSATVPASVPGETRRVRDDTPDHVGSAKFTCRAGAWQKDATGTACYEYPKCSATATTEGNACRVGTYSAAPADTYEDGRCARTDGACAGGSATAVTTSRVDGKCGTALEQCATGTFEQVSDTSTKHRWRCRGANGRKAWSCQGTSGRWKWSCTNFDHTRSDCSLAKTGGAVDCTGSVDRAKSPLCQKSPSCGTLEAAKLVGNTLTCSCVANATRADGACGCDAGYEAVGNSCRIACPSGCSRASCASTSGGNARTVCRCAGSSCPTGYVQSGSCSTTTATTCTGDTDGCGRSVYDTRCRTTSHSFADAPREICRYEHRDRNLFSCRHQTRICQARVTHVGCVSSSSTTPGPFDPGPGDPGPGDPGPGGFSDDGDWSEPARGYLLPTFECGAAANTCTVAFEDETLVSDDYGVVDKADTPESRLWECHSDNGTVRQCSLPKGD